MRFFYKTICACSAYPWRLSLLWFIFYLYSAFWFNLCLTPPASPVQYVFFLGVLVQNVTPWEEVPLLAREGWRGL